MPRFALHLLFLLSGAAALGYQLVWAKTFSAGLGHEMPAVLAIVAAFMGGMALGAAVIDRFIPRSARAGLWLAGLELVIAVWAVAASLGIPALNEIILRTLGLSPSSFQHWFVTFIFPAIALLPATTAMGATLPAMEKFVSVIAPRRSSIGSVYAANTLGAVLGTLAAPYLLMPALGLSRSCWALAVLNVLVSAGAFHLARRSAVSVEAPARKRIAFPANPRLVVTLFFTGLFGIAFETAGVRVLTQVLEGTVYTYAAVLAIFLLGTAAGAAAYHWRWRSNEPLRLLNELLSFTAAACLLAIFFMQHTPQVYRWARTFGDSTFTVLFAELLTAFVALALPTFCMGALFSHLVQLAREARGRIGDVVAWNTVGAALGPVFTVVLLPVIGTHHTLLLISASYAVLMLRTPRLWQVAVLALTLWAGWSANLRIVDVPPGARVTEFKEGIMASVAVLTDTNGHRTLRVDNRYQMGGTAAVDAEYRQAHLPLLLHPEPRRALFLGVGTGISFGAASLYSGLSAHGVELVPEVIEAMPAFAPQNFAPLSQPQLKVFAADARRFVRLSTERYDVIVADLFHPYRDGAGALYTKSHFEAVRARLENGGLFCQWLPLHQLDVPTLRTIVRTFLNVFPNAEAWLLRFNVEVPVLALIGHAGENALGRVETRFDENAFAELKRLALTDSLRLYGHILADADDLERFADEAPVNTDDNQLVTFLAPRAAYRHHGKPYESLIALMEQVNPQQFIKRHFTDANDSSAAERINAYLAARNIYLRGLVHEAEGRRDEALEAYVESARRSSEFTSGYAQCITFASLIAQSDPARAKEILQRLAEAQPQRPVAGELLRRLFPN